MDLINMIFPNIELIQIKNIKLCTSIFDDILQYLTRTKDTGSLKRISINPTKHSIHSSGVIDAIGKYQRRFLDIKYSMKVGKYKDTRLIIDKVDLKHTLSNENDNWPAIHELQQILRSDIKEQKENKMQFEVFVEEKTSTQNITSQSNGSTTNKSQLNVNATKFVPRASLRTINENKQLQTAQIHPYNMFNPTTIGIDHQQTPSQTQLFTKSNYFSAPTMCYSYQPTQQMTACSAPVYVNTSMSDKLNQLNTICNQWFSEISVYQLSESENKNKLKQQLTAFSTVCNQIQNTISIQIKPHVEKVYPTKQESTIAFGYSMHVSKRLNKKIRKVLQERYTDSQQYMRQFAAFHQVHQETIIHEFSFCDSTYRVINFNFHTYTKNANEPLYVLMKMDQSSWKMQHELFTAAEMLTKYQIQSIELPSSIRLNARFQTQLNMKNQMQDILLDMQMLNVIIYNASWGSRKNIPIFNVKNTKYSLSLHLNKQEFVTHLQEYTKKSNEVILIPIAKYDDIEGCHCIQYVWLAQINEYNVGISFRFASQKKTFEPSGIYLNFYDAHKIIPYTVNDPYQKILDGFVTNLHNLTIGNSQQNTINTLRQQNESLKQTIKGLEELKNQHNMDKQMITKLKRENEQLCRKGVNP
eukprot:162998_1